MKRIIIVLAFLLSAGMVFAGGGYEIEPQPQEQRSWSKTFKEPQQLIKSDYKWTPRDYAAVAGVFVSAVGVVGGLYLNSRRKRIQ